MMFGTHRFSTLVSVAASAALLLACGKSPAPDDAKGSSAAPFEPPIIGELFVGSMTADVPVPEGMDIVAKAAVERAFRDPTRFGRGDKDQANACVANVGLGYILLKNGMPTPDADAGEARVVIEAELSCPRVGTADDESRRDVFRVTSVGTEPFAGRAEGPRLLGTLLDEQAKRAAMGLRGQAEMRGAPDAAVVAALNGATRPGVLAEAASEAGERKLAEAFAPLIKLTAHEEAFVSVRAAGALGLLGRQDIDAIRALVDMTKGAALERHFVAINALADIGGKEAARYLDAIATSHPEATIRDLAREAARRAMRLRGDASKEVGTDEGQ